MPDTAREERMLIGGRIDVIVSCIGTAPLRMLTDTTDDDWRWVLETNALGTHRLLRASRC
ncbi:Rossmann-fold NAD(P)-binding domain-containing protein [Thermomonospora amylolytica]|uniref:SDR family oxidoreductase n=1 Tax=Thermomonospora amylolytica TaxID=1411117 RepID=UPI000E6CADA7|nr:SDR family oxidoreductase [Thermomonospora amylolytica]